MLGNNKTQKAFTSKMGRKSGKQIARTICSYIVDY